MDHAENLNNRDDRRLPSLNALRAFEAAARHLSVARAADELRVTPPAVSGQIKSLEAYLGLPLFVRANRRLVLTEAGRAALPRLSDGFEALAEAVRLARAHGRDRSGEHRQRLTVTIPPSLATRWLVPRLESFAGAHPEIDVRLDATMALLDPDDIEVDVAIRYGPGGYRGLSCERLLAESTVAVCSPAIAARLTSADDLNDVTLLHVHDTVHGRDGAPDWRRGLEVLGVRDRDPERGPTFSLQGLAAQAAIEGQGIALLGHAVVDLDLRAGRLVEPFATRFPVDHAIWFLCRPERRDQSPVAEFRHWLFNSVARENPI
ncbi:MAG: transcriptional regulator GcvA [Pseudomonadota bacterium]